MDLIEQYRKQKEKRKVISKKLDNMVNLYTNLRESVENENILKANQIYLIMALQDLKINNNHLLKVPLSSKDKNNKRRRESIRKLKNKIRKIKKCIKEGKMYCPDFIINKKNQLVKVKD